jgi:hypothetical protein
MFLSYGGNLSRQFMKSTVIWNQNDSPPKHKMTRSIQRPKDLDFTVDQNGKESSEARDLLDEPSVGEHIEGAHEGIGSSGDEQGGRSILQHRRGRRADSVEMPPPPHGGPWGRREREAGGGRGAREQ